MSRIRFASLLLALPLLITITRGQSSPPSGLYLSTLPTGSGWTEMQKEVYDLSRQQLESLGATLTENEEAYVLYLDATENDGIVSVSFLMGHALPKEVLELSKNAEVMYTGVSAEKKATFPAEGKWVREKMSEEFVRQFVMPLESRLKQVKEGELNATLRQEVEELFAKYLKRK
jgi:hypothetical protein